MSLFIWRQKVDGVLSLFCEFKRWFIMCVNASRWVWRLIFRLTVNLFNISKLILFFANILKTYCCLYTLCIGSVQITWVFKVDFLYLFSITHSRIKKPPLTTWNQDLLWREHTLPLQYNQLLESTNPSLFYRWKGCTMWPNRDRVCIDKYTDQSPNVYCKNLW